MGSMVFLGTGNIIILVGAPVLTSNRSIGPVILTEGTLSGSSATIPTVTDNLKSQGTITTETIGVYYAPTTVDSITNGELTFGGV